MTDLFSGASLISISDVARFVLTYLLLLGLPGYAMAALARPQAPRAERLALAIPCAYAMVTLCGLTTALLHHPFDVLAYAILAAPITLLWMFTAWTRRRRIRLDTRQTREGAPMPEADHWWLVPCGVSLAQLGALCLMYAGNTVPTGFDILTHVTWIGEISRAHIFPIALLTAHLGSSGGFYPPTFHAVTALLLDLAPMPTYRAAFYGITAIVTLLPFALFTYVRLATGSVRIAGLAVLASLAFEPLPLYAQGVGLYPFVASLLLVPAVAIALRDGLGQGDWRAVGLAALLGVGLFYTHPTEFVTVALLALAIVPGLLRTSGAWLRAAARGLVVAAVWFSAAFPALQAVRSTMVGGAQPEIASRHDFTAPPDVSWMKGLDFYVQWVFGRNVSYLLLAAAVLGVMWCMATRRLLGLAAVMLVATALFVDATTYNILHPFYVVSFPWALWERLAPTSYWFILPVVALGLDAARPAIVWLRRRRSLAFVALSATPCVVLGLLLPFAVTTAVTAAYNRARVVVAPADLSTIRWLAGHVPPGATVANDGDISQLGVLDVPIDAGEWMLLLDGPRPLFARAGDGPGSYADRFYLLRHIADDPMPPHAAHLVDQDHVRYVFYGAGVRQGTARHLNLPHLLADPALHLVYTSAPACGKSSGGDRLTNSCPATGSYVFALVPVPNRTASGIASRSTKTS